METSHPDLQDCRYTTASFIGSGINGNFNGLPISGNLVTTASFIGSGINGNKCYTSHNLSFFLTASFIGSGINGNYPPIGVIAYCTRPLPL